MSWETAAVTKLGGSCCVARTDVSVAHGRSSPGTCPMAGATAAEGSPALWEPQEPFWVLTELLEPVPGW